MSYSVAGFLVEFVRDRPERDFEREVLIEVEGAPRAASLYLPRLGRPPYPAWILLQGVTVPGRFHAGIRRLARAFSAAGQLALAPEVPSWTALRVRPEDALPTVDGALDYLGRHPWVDPHRLGLLAVSVAGTWGLEVAAQKPGTFRVAVAMAAYGNLRRTIRAMVVGEYEWKGKVHRYHPDPYGRWIIGADILPDVAGDAYGTRPEREEVSHALHRLAETAGRNGTEAGMPTFDPLIQELRRHLPDGGLAAYDLLAAPSDNLVPDPPAGRALADVLTDAGLRRDPSLAPAGALTTLRTPVIFVHGRHDRLIPYVEAYRLAAALPPSVPRSLTITDLIGHAKISLGVLFTNPLVFGLDAIQFVRLVKRMVGAVSGD